ncbi:9772_t:CDS:10, partial [Gigaspora margarita]
KIEAFYKRPEGQGFKYFRQTFKDLEKGDSECGLIPNEREKERLQLTFDKTKYPEWRLLKEQLRQDRVLIVFGRLNQVINPKTGGRSFSVYRLVLMPENIIEIRDPDKGSMKEAEQALEKDFSYLEKTTNKPREFLFNEALALVEYIEDMEDIRDSEKYEKRKKAGKVKYYTSAEANQRLKELRAKNALSKLDKETEKKIKDQTEKALSSNPFSNGKPLTGDKSYRAIYEIIELIYRIRGKEVIIAVVKVGERKPGEDDDVYGGGHPTSILKGPRITERPKARDFKRKVVGDRGRRKTCEDKNWICHVESAERLIKEIKPSLFLFEDVKQYAGNSKGFVNYHFRNVVKAGGAVEKKYSLSNNPQKSGICKKIGVNKPRKPNSANRAYARVILKNKKEITVYIPGEKHNLQEFSSVLISGGGAQDLPGVKYHVVRGYGDTEGVKERKQGRSLYGAKKTKNIYQQAEKISKLEKIKVGGSLLVSGKLVLTPEREQPCELQDAKIEIVNPTGSDYSLQKKNIPLEVIRNFPHLRAKTNYFLAIFRLRHSISKAIHDFFHQEGFYYVPTPIITSNDTEGAGELFNITTNEKEPFFPKSVKLTVSGQLQAEALAQGLDQITDLAERLIKYVTNYVLENNISELEYLEKYNRKEIISKLKKITRMDLQSEHEKYLCHNFANSPVFVINYPADLKAFYMKNKVLPKVKDE